MKTLLFLKTHLMGLALTGCLLAFVPAVPAVAASHTSPPIAGQAATVNAPFALRINSGGQKVTYGQEVFEKDKYYNGYGKSYSNPSVKNIKNTARDALYLTERSTLMGRSTFDYAIAVPNGTYTVKLHFAEIYWGATGGAEANAGDRIFDVSIENKKVLSNFDIVKEVGSMAALVKTYTIKVTDGKMNLNFKAYKDQPKLSALEILQVIKINTNEAVYINAGGGTVKVGTKTFSADRFYKGGRSFSNTAIKDIKKTTADALYTSERSSGVEKGKFAYEIPVSNGDYEVKLHFAELWWDAIGGQKPGIGQRRFSTNLEGKPIIKDLDLVKESGSMTAVIKTYTTTVNDGTLNLDFSASKDEPKVSAIEVVKVRDRQQQKPQNAIALINCGGPSISYGGKTYAADKFYDSNSQIYVQDDGGIDNTIEDVVYNSERISSADKGSFGYAIPVRNGYYSVKLHFAEIYWSQNGERLMDATIEGKKVINDLDIYKAVGKRTALVKTYNATVSDGVLNINFSAGIDRPKISAIAIYAADDLPPAEDLPLLVRLNTGGPALKENGVDFEKDDYFSSGTEANTVNLPSIKNTDTDSAYKSERSADRDFGRFSYNFPISNGEYQVKLHFAEIWFGTPYGEPGHIGQRIFDVALESKKVINDLDLIKEVGSQTALVKTFTVNVTDGELDIDFSAKKNRPTISAIEIYGHGKLEEPKSDPCQWHPLASSSIKKTEAQSASVDNKLYTLAGFTSGLKILATTEIYDPANDIWSKGAPMPLPVTHMGVCVIGKDIWVVGGFTGNDPGVATNRVQIYNTASNTWRKGPPLPHRRASGAAVYNAGKIHFFGGLLPDRMTDVDEHYVLDPKNPSEGWKPAAKLPHARNHLSGASVDGIVYAIGGQYGHDHVDPKNQKWMEAYDPATDSWTRKADLPSARSHFEPGTVVHNGKIIIVGGRRGWYYFFDDITQYDPATNSWTELCKLPNRNMAPNVMVYQDRLIVANGGINGEKHPTKEVNWVHIDPERNQPAAVAKILKAPEETIAPEAILFPNPTAGAISLQVQGLNPKEKMKLTVKNMSGLPLMEQEVMPDNAKNSYPLATDNLKQGIYFVEITQGSTTKKVLRFVKL